MLFNRVEIPIRVQEIVAVLDSEGRDQRVDGLAHRDALGAQGSSVGRAPERNIAPEHGAELQPIQSPSGAAEIPVVAEALKNLGKTRRG